MANEPAEKKKGFFAEFKEFIAKGNVMDMAVGIIVGSAFTKIVNSLVADILNPIVAFFTGGKSLAGLKYVITEAKVEGDTVLVEEAAIKYGQFLQNIIDFLLVALVVFLLVRGMNRLRRRAEAEKDKLIAKKEKAEETDAKEE
ncbi:MAG: large conductance mechanosensitive channel protein MscL [Clostridia bacterium]|nr:large conductance mechanosensitive channel protein MscL [Clostridia bacterium]